MGSRPDGQIHLNLSLTREGGISALGRLGGARELQPVPDLEAERQPVPACQPARGIQKDGLLRRAFGQKGLCRAALPQFGRPRPGAAHGHGDPGFAMAAFKLLLGRGIAHRLIPFRVQTASPFGQNNLHPAKI